MAATLQIGTFSKAELHAQHRAIETGLPVKMVAPEAISRVN